MCRRCWPLPEKSSRMNPRSGAHRFVFVVGLAMACAVSCRDSKEPPANRDAPAARVATAVIVIHGVGNQATGYSKPLQDLMKAENPSLHFIEVLWSDLGSLLRQAGSISKERQAAEQQLLDEINAAEQRALASRKASASPPEDETQLRDEYAAARGFVGPIVRYEFLSGAERSRIQQRLREALDWSAKNADKTVVIAHSLGSVIAFDSLHAWEAGSPPARIALLSTMGSPLGKRVFVGRRGRPSTRPGNADAWINFHSPTDPIASPLAASYADVEDRDVKTSILPLSAHSAYWTHTDVLRELLKTLQK